MMATKQATRPKSVIVTFSLPAEVEAETVALCPGEAPIGRFEAARPTATRRPPGAETVGFDAFNQAPALRTPDA